MRGTCTINGLVEEALNLAYHGARAHDASFNITLERDLDPAIAPIELAPQEITRVLLNLFGNGFYAANKRQCDGAARDFRPTLKVTTRDLGDAIEVQLRDNGTGIAPEIRDKLFQPFVTTKPTGEGTGLGLSIAWDIVTQQHSGTIAVDSLPREFSEFTIRLPRRGVIGQGTYAVHFANLASIRWAMGSNCWARSSSDFDNYPMPLTEEAHRSIEWPLIDCLIDLGAAANVAKGAP